MTDACIPLAPIKLRRITHILFYAVRLTDHPAPTLPQSFAPTQLCYADDTRSLLLHNLAAGLLLHVCHGLLLS